MANFIQRQILSDFPVVGGLSIFFIADYGLQYGGIFNQTQAGIIGFILMLTVLMGAGIVIDHIVRGLDCVVGELYPLDFAVNWFIDHWDAEIETSPGKYSKRGKLKYGFGHPNYGHIEDILFLSDQLPFSKILESSKTTVHLFGQEFDHGHSYLLTMEEMPVPIPKLNSDNYILVVKVIWSKGHSTAWRKTPIQPGFENEITA